MRLIDLDALIAKNCENIETEHHMRIAQLLTNLVNAPTISPDSLRPKGRWEWYKNHYECSNCRGSRFHDLVLGLDAQFCGRCGADMRGEE